MIKYFDPGGYHEFNYHVTLNMSISWKQCLDLSLGIMVAQKYNLILFTQFFSLHTHSFLSAPISFLSPPNSPTPPPPSWGPIKVVLMYSGVLEFLNTFSIRVAERKYCTSGPPFSLFNRQQVALRAPLFYTG